jgi:hypothetical protein
VVSEIVVLVPIWVRGDATCSAKLNLKLELRIEIPSGDTVSETPQLTQLFELANVRSSNPPEHCGLHFGALLAESITLTYSSPKYIRTIILYVAIEETEKSQNERKYDEAAKGYVRYDFRNPHAVHLSGRN